RLRVLPGRQRDRGNDRHDVGHPQLRDQRRGAQPGQEHAAGPAQAGRVLMSSVSSVGQGGTYVSEESVSKAVNLSEATQLENSFISLMVAQIQYQDPTSPVDSTQFLNQFSAMSQVKSMENMTSLAQNNLILMDNLQTLTAAGLVGQQVRVTVDSLQLGTQPLQGQFTLAHASNRTAVVLTDSNGIK